jgi:hypothetical protein
MFSFLGKNIEPRLDATAAFQEAKGAKDFFLRALRAFAVFLLIGKFLQPNRLQQIYPFTTNRRESGFSSGRDRTIWSNKQKSLPSAGFVPIATPSTGIPS